MTITCPHCNFSREVADSQVPDRPVKVTCPKCQQGFTFDKSASGVVPPAEEFRAAVTDSAPAAPLEARTVCPACGLEQAAGDSCGGCGVVYAKWQARQQSRGETQAGAAAQAPAGLSGYEAFRKPSPADLPKAGFWIRVVASMIDGLLLGAVQFVIGLVLGFAGGAAGGAESFAIFAITWLCSVVISVTYYVFFTGYNGQTPGKMALRLQVVRTDGTPMTYGKAFLREIPCKFISGILLGIGYLMVAFDQQKQGLHDRMAGTYVIRL
jgi:predicted Zn finger-like uncharacterized protein